MFEIMSSSIKLPRMSTSQDYIEEQNYAVNNWKKETVILVSLGLSFFFSSLLLTVFFTTGDNIQGFWVLLIGWMGILIFQFSWLANPLNLLALLLLKKHPYISALLTTVALLLATQTFYFFEIPIGLKDKKIFIKELGLGFYLWYAAQIIFMVAIYFEAYKNKKA